MPLVLHPRPPRARLRQRHAGLRRAETQALLRLCRTVSLFLAVDGPRWCGPWTLRDFARGQIGVPLPTLLGWKRVGRLVLDRPELARAWRAGELTFRDLDHRARSGGVGPEGAGGGDSGASSTSGGTGARSRSGAPARTASGSTSTFESDPGHRRVNLSLPTPVARRLRESLQVGRALLGVDVDDGEVFAALLAEASTEIEPTVDCAEARQRLKLPPARPSRRRDRGASPSPDPRVAALRAPALRRRLAHRLFRLLQRQLGRHQRAKVRQEDALLRLLEEKEHLHAGYPSLEVFAREILDLPASTLWDRVRRARLRRRQDPLTLARGQGRLTAVQHELLDQLRRRCHVPLSDQPRWIEWARGHTTVALREALRWALDQRDTDYRAWEGRGCPPPTADQLRTAKRPLHEVAAAPTPLDLRRLAQAPTTSLPLVLAEDVVDLLAVLVVSLQDRAKRQDGARLPVWGAVLQLDHLARKSWAVHLQPLKGRIREVFDRDDGTCVVPECTQRCDLHAHHLQYRSRGGDDAVTNLVMLCWRHHQHGVHGGPMRVRGKAAPDASALTWEMGLDEHDRPLRVYRGEVVLA